MTTSKSSTRISAKSYCFAPLLVILASVFVLHTSAPVRIEGVWSARIDGTSINFQFKKDEQDKALYGNDFPVTAFAQLPRGKSGDFTLVRPAGTIEFNGNFNGNQGTGKFVFNSDQNFQQSVINEGVRIVNERDMMDLYIVDINLAYIRMLKTKGYNRVPKDELVSLAAVGVDAAFIDAMREAGFPNVTLQELVELKSLHVEKSTVATFRESGFKYITARELVSLISLGVTIEKLREYLTAWPGSPGVNDLVEAAAAKVTPEMVSDLRKKGKDANGIRNYIRSVQ